MANTVTVAPTIGHAVLATQAGVGAAPGFDAVDLRRMIQAASGAQEGVFDATGWKVTQRGAGANMTVDVAANVGLAQIDGDAVAFQSRYVISPHSAVINLDIAANSSGNPRLDQIILDVRDTTHDGSGSNDARCRVLQGTATSGATLDNRSGAAALPGGAIRLADVLVANGAASITNAVIRDRRLWARGFNARVKRTQNAGGGSDYTTTSGSMVDVDATNLALRLECSGAPVRIGLVARPFTNTAGSGYGMQLRTVMDGAQVDGAHSQPTNHNSATNADLASGRIYEVTFAPAAGTHLFKLQWMVAIGGTALLGATATNALFWTLEEMAGRPFTDNGTA